MILGGSDIYYHYTLALRQAIYAERIWGVTRSKMGPFHAILVGFSALGAPNK